MTQLGERSADEVGGGFGSAGVTNGRVSEREILKASGRFCEGGGGGGSVASTGSVRCSSRGPFLANASRTCRPDAGERNVWAIFGEEAMPLPFLQFRIVRQT